MKINKRTEFIIFLIILALFGLGIYFYPQMPSLMASHWNSQGEADGYLPRFWGLFIIPLISVFLALLFHFIPKIDPLQENVVKFRPYFDNFVLLILLFLFYLYLLTLVWNLNYRFDIRRYLLPFLALLFYYCGILIEKAKRNWFIGIRTPWTLSDDKVWAKTHHLGGKLFRICSLLALLGWLIPQIAFYLVILPVVLFSFFLVVYSYYQYRNLNI